jgi:hypothetical protein
VTAAFAKTCVAKRPRGICSLGLMPERLSFMDFARSCIPMTVASMTVAAVWLWLTGVLEW